MVEARETDSLSDVLHSLGCSGAEASVYRTAADLGEPTVRTIAEQCEVSRRHVYDVCESLEAMGFLEHVDHARPTRVRLHRGDALREQLGARIDDLFADFERIAASTGDVSETERRSVVRRLQTYGLSGTEAETYLALLERGPATVEELARAVDVTKQSVYRARDGLVEAGFATVRDDESPTVVDVRDLDSLRDAFHRRVESLVTSLGDPGGASTPGEGVEVLKSRAASVERVRELLARARREVLVSVPVQFLDTVADDLRAAVEETGFVLLLVSDLDGQAGRAPVCEAVDGLGTVVSGFDYWMPTTVVVDVDEVGLMTTKERLTRPRSDLETIVYDNERFVYVLHSAFLQKEWRLADQYLTSEPEPLPHQTSFHAALVQAALHEREGTPLRASITGTPTGNVDPATRSGESGRLSGEVVDVRQGYVEPFSDTFTAENALDLRLDDGRIVSVGSPTAIVEDYAAHSVRLERA